VPVQRTIASDSTHLTPHKHLSVASDNFSAMQPRLTESSIPLTLRLATIPTNESPAASASRRFCRGAPSGRPGRIPSRPRSPKPSSAPHKNQKHNLNSPLPIHDFRAAGDPPHLNHYTKAPRRPPYSKRAPSFMPNPRPSPSQTRPNFRRRHSPQNEPRNPTHLKFSPSNFSPVLFAPRQRV
jgi:hypothetical protein